MEELITYRQAAQYDPSMTTGLRNAFSRDMQRRFAELIKVIRKAITIEDVLGLKKPQVYQMTTPGYKAFAFRRDATKIEEFMSWLKEQVDKGILEVREYQQVGSAVENAWTNLYIADSYKRGLQRARTELIKAGYDVPSIEDSGGINVNMKNIFHIDRLGILFTRVFSDLKGVTDAMDAQIARILAQGIADGDGMLLLARKLVATINGTGMGDLAITDTLGRFIPAARRAEMIARTEILRAFNQAQLVDFRNWGVEGIDILAEIKTAGDSRVCEQCSPLEGKIYTLDEAEGLLPLHPMCRCIYLPHVQELTKYYKK